MDVAGRNAVVTGAAGGIGAALASELTSRGARVLLADIDPAVEQTAEGLGQAHWTGDVASADGVTGLLEAARAQLGEVDLYFANAGIGGASGLGDYEDWDTVLDVNLRAHIRAAQRLIPEWTARGGLLRRDGLGRGSADPDRLRRVLGHEARGTGVRGMAVRHLRRRRGPRVRPRPHGRQHEDPLGRRGQPEDGRCARRAEGRVRSGQRARSRRCRRHGARSGREGGSSSILPHPEVLDMYRMKGSDYDRWLTGMRRYQAKLRAIAQGG